MKFQIVKGKSTTQPYFGIVLSNVPSCRPCVFLTVMELFWPLQLYIWKASWSVYMSSWIPDQAD